MKVGVLTEKNFAIERLFRPRSVAIIGASNDPLKIAGRPLHYLESDGFDGEIWPINPRYTKIGKHPCYACVGDLPGPPDVAILLVGPAHAEEYLRDLAKHGTTAAIALGGGYGETGPDGKARQDRLCHASGAMRLLGPNTIGIVNLRDSVTLSASGALDAQDRQTGSIAVVSQSGGILGSLMSRAAYRGIGLNQLIATGNEADLEVCDFIEYLIDDPGTSVIALYLETLRDPNRFRTVAMRAHKKKKPLVIYKVGRSEPGARSAASHTGAMAGEDRAYHGLFQQVGAIRVNTFDDLLNVPMALSNNIKLKGKRVAILTTTGGAGGLIADVCGVTGFDTPYPGRSTVNRLNSLLNHDGYAPNRNPIDLTLAGLRPEIIKGAIFSLIESRDFDALVPIIGSSSVGRPDLVAEPVIEAFKFARKPILVYSSPSAPEIIQRLNSNGVPAFDTPEGCAAALSALAKFQ